MHSTDIPFSKLPETTIHILADGSWSYAEDGLPETDDYMTVVVPDYVKDIDAWATNLQTVPSP